MRAVLAALDEASRDAAARTVVAPLLAVAGGGPVALFASMGHELSTEPLDEALRAHGVARVLPRVTGDELVFRAVPGDVRAAALPPAHFGAPEPPADDHRFPVVDLARCSAVVVPGLAFDGDGWRIGYGRGFYDRALAGVDLERVVGVGYDQQLVDRVPHGPGDVRLRRLCAPSNGVFRVPR